MRRSEIIRGRIRKRKLSGRKVQALGGPTHTQVNAIMRGMEPTGHNVERFVDAGLLTEEEAVEILIELDEPIPQKLVLLAARKMRQPERRAASNRPRPALEAMAPNGAGWV